MTGMTGMTGSKWCIGALLTAIAWSVPLHAAPTGVGRVKVAAGATFFVRDGIPVRAQLGDVVFESDTLRTGTDGSMGVTLKDDTRVSIGPNSELRVERFLYAPADGGLALVLKFVSGVAAYVSGHIAKLAPDSIRLETPSAIVGVRGTTLAIRVEP
jgi:hypothetical protein